MKRRNKLLWILVILSVIVSGLSGAAFGISDPVLTYTASGTGSALVYIEGLDGTDVYAVQQELTFAGAYPDAKFTAYDSTAYQPERAPVVQDGTTTLTVYLVNGDKPLTRGRTLTLGTLSLGESFTMPATAKLSALDEASRPLAGVDEATVEVRRHVDPSSGPSPTPTPTPAGNLPFTDVESRHWFYQAVKFAYENKLMSGMTATGFAPDTPTNRGMVVAILYRMEGSPAAGRADFADVPEDKYYTKPIAWATAKGIVSGYPNGTFEPESNITRAQLAAILYRYAGYKGYDTAARSGLAGFQDFADVSAYAEDALQWATGAGLMSGVTKMTLVPKGPATRAQVASILMRFAETVAK